MRAISVTSGELGRAASVLTALALGIATVSCQYLTIPRGVAVDGLTAPRTWASVEIGGYTRGQLLDAGVVGLERWGWGPGQRIAPPEPESIAPGDYLEILHLSDAQIRDQSILTRSDYELYDQILSSTLRLELIEDFDSLLLAAILRGYRLTAADYSQERRAVVAAVHTGDLIDISLVTELMDASAAVRYACNAIAEGNEEVPPLGFLSVPGNHDGLTFGVIDDKHSRTWEIGLNRLEFHLASMALLGAVWPDEMATHNEAVDAVLSREVAALYGAPVFSIRIRELAASGQGVSPTLERVPIALKARVNTPNEEDNALQPGYFSVSRNGFRIIVLDTRAERTHAGAVGHVQLGWLYHELKESLASREPALVFAHHHPEAFTDGIVNLIVGDSGSDQLQAILDSFPHVLGYFYGHAHRYKAGVEGEMLYVQSPSLVDYPQGALLVRIEREAATSRYEVQIDHVKAAPNRATGPGLVFDGVQDEAHVYAQFDALESRTNPDAKREVPYGDLAQPSDGKRFVREISWDSDDKKLSAEELFGGAKGVARISEARTQLLGEPAGRWAE